MKLSTKPISNPGQPEKYPPPLMRFLRSNAGSRSRGKSRTSPMFIRKKNSNIETQEPSSPKVTCMGQVRVKRSKKPGSKPVRPGDPTRPRHGSCEWIANALFSHRWKNCRAFFRTVCYRKHRNGQDSSKFGVKNEDSVQEDDEKEAKIFSSTPKNALMLTRCRSAPYKPSSLACRFWGSPLANKEETGETELENRGFDEEQEEDENPISIKESICRKSDQETQIDSGTEENLGFCKIFEEKKVEKSVICEELKTEEFGDVRPLILTRCKSEPATTAERRENWV